MGFLASDMLIILEQGYTEAQLKECLEEYAALNVWQIHPDSFNIRFIDAWLAMEQWNQYFYSRCLPCY